MGVIHLKDIRVYSNHGCLEEEAAIGSEYLVNLKVWTNLMPSALSDNLADTVDYVLLNRIVKEEMAVRSKLLEHVSKRIIDRVFKEARAVVKLRITVAKINPPIGGDVAEVSVSMDVEREIYINS
ncbi:MAG TPA: dihydroneopterin aldolase [Flavobacteriaceae bacterium]|nr:dihydroneopterin aldolase [Flavobacteriaceae bacterium]